MDTTDTGLVLGGAIGEFAGALVNEFANAAHQKQHPYPGHSVASYPSPASPIYNPPVPLVKNITGVYPKQMIFIGGIPNPNATRMTFNLDTSDGIAFHFDARFNNQVVVRNSHIQGVGWGKEERDMAYFPFQPDVFFETIILVEASCFKVAVNNEHLVKYFHRIERLESIDKLRITGDVRLTHIRFQD